MILAGNLNDTRLLDQDNRVYSSDGIAPSIVQRFDIKSDKGTKIQLKGYVGRKAQHTAVYSGGGVAPTIASCDWKDPCKVIVSKGGVNE